MIGIIPNSKEMRKLLTDRGLKPTYQRLMIIDHLNKSKKSHLTAEKIYTALTDKMPMLSMTTVYNTLNSFLKAGIVSAITITGTEIRYGFITTPHHHFLCRNCGSITDIDIACPIAERKVVDGHKIEEIHGYFKGLCKKCLRKGRKQKI
ncbi:MAG: transcriptional repressor [candidate division WOR-3 bacterium]|nr:transcriptional repressor [candidate division WOR-3 bacterium]